MAAADAPRTAVFVVDDEVDVMVAELDGRRLDLALVNVLARLQLTARRHGFTVRLVDPSDELQALLELVGLADVFGARPSAERQRGLLGRNVAGPAAGGAEPSSASAASWLVVEPGRQAEGGEQVGVEEVVVADDPVA